MREAVQEGNPLLYSEEQDIMALQQAQEEVGGFRTVHRAIPTEEGEWRRGGELVRVKMVDLEPALPPGVAIADVKSFCVWYFADGRWHDLPVHIDYADSQGRWSGPGSYTPSTLLCFPAPAHTEATETSPPGGSDYAGYIPLTLWDARERARLSEIRLYYAFFPMSPLTPPRSTLQLVDTGSGYAVRDGGQTLLHFTAARHYQIDFAGLDTIDQNLVPEGRTWRWLLTETPGEMGARSRDKVTFRPVVTDGPVLVVNVTGASTAGKMSATLRIFRHRGALVLEFADYRATRTRDELPPKAHPRSYAGQIASPFPGFHYAAFMLEMHLRDVEVVDHLYPYRTIPTDGQPALVYERERKQQGWNWLALCSGSGVAGIAVHSRTQLPDHPFKTGRVAKRTIIALEPFGSEVEGKYTSCDRYLLVLARDVDAMRETFDALDTYPLLADVPCRREPALLDTCAYLCRWINLNLFYLIHDGHYRNALRTDRTYRDNHNTPLVPFAEMIRLYEKTGWETFRATAEHAAAFAAQWILDGKFTTRGKGVGPNGGGIYQHEQIYLLLALARVYRVSRDPLLTQAIAAGVAAMQQTRGGWDDDLWHAGGWRPNGRPLFYWPVNTNAFATCCFRLYQLLGDKAYYEQAMTVVADCLARLGPDSWEIFAGGGVSDTTRAAHLFAEALEVAADDPRLDPAHLKACIEHTLERFWIEGWLPVRHAIYGEVIRAGQTPGEPFSPGFRHWHTCGAHLDILPRMQTAAAAGVGEHLTRWAMRAYALDFDLRSGFEERTHLTRFSMRDTDIEPASWLDCELLPTLFAVYRRGWMSETDFHRLYYKIHRMVQRTYIPFDDEHGGWANAYRYPDGRAVKYLAYWEQRHAYAAYTPEEPRELWGFITRDAGYDHSTNYWHALEQLVDLLMKVETVGLDGTCQLLLLLDEGLAAGLPIPRPILAPKLPEADDVTLLGPAWTISERRTVSIDGHPFWLLEARPGTALAGKPGSVNAG